MLKILLIHNFYKNTTGEDIFVLSQEKLLRQHGVAVIPFFKNNTTIPKNPLLQGKIAAGLFHNEVITNQLIAIIKKNKPDIAHVHNVYPLITPVVYKICKQLGVPVVQTIHNYRLTCPKSFLFRNGRTCELCVGKRFFYPAVVHKCFQGNHLATLTFAAAQLKHREQGAFNAIDAFVFPAEFPRQYHVERLGIPKEKTYVLPNFVDIKAIAKPKRAGGDYFLFAGRLSEEKGILMLLAVFAGLPNHRLIVAGDGPLKELVKSYETYPNISVRRFLPQSQIYHLMRGARATIIPSVWYEVLPMVMLESFANGTPVLVPRFGTFPDVVEEKKTGIFFEYNNSENLKEKIIFMGDHQQLVQSMGMFARNVYTRRYTPDMHYQALKTIYMDVMEKQNKLFPKRITL